MASKKDIEKSAFAKEFCEEWKKVVHMLRRYDLSKCVLVPEKTEYFVNKLKKEEK